MLDILKLHNPKDNADSRAWILANGKNLRKEINNIQSELYKSLQKEDLIFYLSKKVGVKLRIRLNNSSVKEWLSQTNGLMTRKSIPVKKLMEISGTSYEDLIKIQEGKHLPSCRKLNRIAKLVGLKIVSICRNSDFCLRSIDTIIESLSSDWIPIVVIDGLIELYEKFVSNGENVKENLLNSIEKLKVLHYNSKPIKAVKKIDLKLSKILGAFAADGNYYPPDMLRWEDEYKEQLVVLSNWFNDVFGIKLKIKSSNRDRRSFTTKFRNKIIGRYLETFFNYKPGSKTYSVDEPSIIKKQTLRIRKAFAAGALMFDGSVNLDGSISFSSISKRFRDSISEILSEDGIKLSIPNKPDISIGFGKRSIWYFSSSRKIDIRQSKKLSFYFEKNTLKRKIIDFYLGTDKISNIDDLRHLFPKIKSSLHPTDLFLIISDMKNPDVYQLIEKTNLSRQTLIRYLRMLENTGIITSTIKDRKRIYIPTNVSTNLLGSYATKSSSL